MDPSEATLAAAAIAGLIALAGIMGQRRSQARIARLTLFAQRLAVYEVIEELATTAAEAAGSLHMFGFDMETRELVARLGDAERAAIGISNRAYFLFGDDIEVFLSDLIGAASELRVLRLRGHTGPEVRRARDVIYGRCKELRSTFAPYLAQDRTFGRESEWLVSPDPAFAPREPYRPGSPH